MRKISKLLTIGMLLFLFSSQLVLGNSWGDPKTYSLTRGGSFKTATVDGTRMASRKTTESKYWDVHTISKTMWSTPKIRMVNSENDARSEEMSTPSAGKTKRGSSNTGAPNHFYYGSVKPAGSQVGTDTIRLQLKAR